jgi:hypothetical protein
MEAVIIGQEAVQTADSVARRLVSDARRTYDAQIDDAFLEECARDAVNDVWHDSVKVTTFVPLLAMRRMREIVSSRATTLAAARVD